MRRALEAIRDYGTSMPPAEWDTRYPEYARLKTKAGDVRGEIAIRALATLDRKLVSTIRELEEEP